MPAALEILWAFIGLLLTIGGTFLEASMTSPPWSWSQQGISIYSLGVTYQIGAVLLVGCVGGKNAGALSQIAYLILGLTWLPVFTKGGGWGYLKEPTFGYLLGFIPGAWVCGALAFQAPARLESLAFSSLCGLFSIHVTGLLYLILSYFFSGGASNPLPTGGLETFPLVQEILKYSIYPLPAQLAVACAVTVLAFVLRRLMFY